MKFRFLTKRTIAFLLVLGMVVTNIPNLVFALGEQEKDLSEDTQQEIDLDGVQQIRGVQLSFAPQKGQESVWMGETGTFYLNVKVPDEFGAKISLHLPINALQAIQQAQPDGIGWSDTMGNSVPTELAEEGDSVVLQFSLDAGQAMLNQPLSLIYENGMYEEFSIQVSEADILVEELWPEQEALTIGASQSEPLIEDEFEQPEGEDELQQPEGEDELEQPEGEDEFEQPEGEDELEQPEGGDEFQQPEGEDELQQPEGEEELQQPEGEEELQQPEGEDELQQPEGEEGLQQPEGEEGLQQPEGEENFQQPEEGGNEDFQQIQQFAENTIEVQPLSDLQIVQSFDVDTTRQLQVGNIEETDWQGKQRNNQQPVEDVQQHPEAIHELSGGTLTFLVQPFSWGELVLTTSEEEQPEEIERSDLFEMQPRTVGKVMPASMLLYQMGMVQLPERSLLAGNWLSASLDGVTPPAQEESKRAFDQDYTYHVTIQSGNDAQTGTIYTREWAVTQTFTLPQGVEFPQGEAQVVGNQVLINGVAVLSFEDLDITGNVLPTAEDLSAVITDNVLKVTYTKEITDVENQTEELSAPDLQFVLHGSALTVLDEFVEGEINVSTSFTAVPQTGEAVTRSATAATLLSLAPLSANGGTGTRSTPSVEVTYEMPSTPTFDKDGKLQVTYQIKVKNTSDTDKAEVIITMNAPTETDTTVAPTVSTDTGKTWDNGKIIWGDTTTPVSIAVGETWERTVTVTLTDATQNNPPTELKSSVSVASSDASAGTTPVTKEDVYNLKEFLEDQKETVTIKTKATCTKEIFWIDDNNTGSRPDQTTYKDGLQLKFCILNKGQTEKDITDKDYTILTAANMAQVGLTSIDDLITISGSGNQWTASASLPSTISYGENINNFTREVVWKYVPKNDVANYTLWDTDNVSGTQMQTEGWYYLLEEPFTFTVELRNGEKVDPDTGTIKDLIVNNFTLYYEAKDVQGGTGTIKLDELLTSGTTESDCEVQDNGDGTYTVKITGLGTYSAYGNRVQYALQLTNNDTTLSANGIGENGDWLTVEYKTQGVNNEKLFDGDNMVLTLQGHTTYTANKVWLDTGDTAQRPTGRFELWRYRPGKESWQQASAVRGADGSILTVELDTSGNQTIDFDNAQLDKYGPEGYEYVYICKEIIETPGSANYEQVFGSVDQDGKVTDILPAGETRETGNIYIYDNGTITNRITASRIISATKRWEASSFQSQLSEFVVELQLYSRPKGSPDGTSWDVEEGKVLTMKGFTSEQLQQSDSMSVPTYDDQGQPLEYKFVEEKVYLNTAPDTNLLRTGDDGSKTIKWTDANGQTVVFESIQPTEAEIQAGKAAIVNKVKDTINYDFTKIWQAGWTEEKLQEIVQKGGVTFTLYSRGRDGESKELFKVTLDGTEDNPEKEHTVKIGQEIYTVTVQELGALPKDQIEEDAARWPVHIEGLPRYDEGGYQIEYFVFEQDTTYVADYNITRDPVTGDYNGTVTNPPPGPGGGHRILIRKRWIDDSDLYHREDVIITAYYHVDGENNDVELGTLTLEANGVGMDYLYFGDDVLDEAGIDNYQENNVYVLETQMGDTQITGGAVKQDGTNYVGETNKVLAKYHDYEITYSIAEKGAPGNIADEKVYIVTNRRLGSINITAAKSWKDGGKLQQALKNAGITPVLVLEFDAQDQSNSEYPNYKIDYDVNTVTLGGQDEMEIQDNKEKKSTAILPLNLGTDNSTENYYFFNLPKYNTLGEVVHYTIKEMWYQGDTANISIDNCKEKDELIKDLSNDSSKAELIQLLNECNSVIETTGYDVSHDEGGDDADDQQMSVTNTLSGTKDVSFHKTWIDQYVYRVLNKRPDIYLTLYRLNNDSNELEEVTPYKDRIWTEFKDSQWTEYQWSCHFSDLPKYDSEGREIFYYATERMAADGENFDYVPVELSYIGADGNEVAEGTEVDNNAWKMPISDDEEAVLEGGTFTNRIEAPAEISGVKLWDNLPYLWKAEDLPTVTFTITKEGVLDNNGSPTVDGVDNAGTKIATVTIETGQWTNKVKTDFKVTQQTDYTMTRDGLKPDNPNAEEIPKYNEKGQQYVYTLTETIKFEDGTTVSTDQVFSKVVSNGYQIKNEYNSQLGAIQVKKLLQVGKDWKVYPAVTIELVREYTTNGEDYQPDNGFTTRSITWSSKDVAGDATAAAAGTDGTVVLDKLFTFENLEIYQPNGYEYHYYVREKVDGYLNYTSGVKKGGITLVDFDEIFTADDGIKDGNYLKYQDALEPTPNENNATATSLQPSATFGDKYEAGTANLTGTKVWNDQNDALDLRPDITTDTDFLKSFTLYRSAPAQPGGEGNEIEEEPVPGYEDGTTWTWTDNKNGTWTYTIENLEKVAPNGMNWVYTVKEDTSTLSQYYYYPKSATATGSWGNDNIYQVDPLTNSLTTQVGFRKQWIDEDGQELKEDYLGAGEVSVTCELYVAEGEDGVLQKASDYFKGADGKFKAPWNQWFADNYSFTATQTHQFGATFGSATRLSSLPIVNADGEYLYYCFAETKVEILGVVQEYNIKVDEQILTPTEKEPNKLGALFTPQSTEAKKWSDGISYILLVPANQMKTQELTVKKLWTDETGTPLTTDLPKEVNLVIQRKDSKASDDSWATALDKDGTTPLVVTLKAGSWQATIQNLPTSGIENKTVVTYDYRARELKEGWTGPAVTDDDILDAGGKFGSDYTVSYQDGTGSTTVTNQRTHMTLTAEKKWQPGVPSKGKSVTLTLYQRVKGTDDWREFSYNGAAAQVELDGTADTPTDTCYASAAWIATWKNLPRADGNTLYEYKVEETAVDPTITENIFVIQPTNTVDSSTADKKFTVINLPLGSLNIVKQDSDGKDLSGVVFELQYQDSTGSWQLIDNSVCKEANFNAQQKTNADGEVAYTKLLLVDENGAQIKYRIVEISTPDGYNRLTEPIPVSFETTDTPKELYWTMAANNKLASEVTYTVHNNQYFKTINTGADGFFWPGIAGAGAACAGVWYLASRGSRRSRRNKRRSGR